MESSEKPTGNDKKINENEEAPHHLTFDEQVENEALLGHPDGKYLYHIFILTKNVQFYKKHRSY